VTTGAPRARLESLLGPDYARGQRSGTAAPPVDVSQAVAPAGYTRQQQDLAALASQSETLTSRLGNLIDTPIEGNQISSGHFNILQGNVVEALARPILDEALADVRRDAPDAQLFLGVQARVTRRYGTLSDPVLFSDGLIAAVRPDGLQIFRVAEIKSGAEGGVTGQEQIHRWIERHSSDEIVLILPGVSRTFRLSDTVREVVGLARAPRLLIAPRGATFTTERSGHGVAAPVERRELAQSAEEIAYLSRLVAQQIIQFQQARRLLAEVHTQQLAAAQLASLSELQQPETVRRLLRENNGTALVQGQLFRVAIEGDTTPIRLLQPAPIAVPRIAAPGTAAGAPGAAALPPGRGGAVPPAVGPTPQPTPGPVPALPPPRGGGAAGPLHVPFAPPGAGPVPPNIINFTGNDIIVGGRRVAPTPSEPLRAGDIVVAGSTGYWLVLDQRTGQPIAGVFEGGRWYRVVSGGTVLTLDANGRVRTETEPLRLELIPGAAQARPTGPGGAASAGQAATAAQHQARGSRNQFLGPIRRQSVGRRVEPERAQAPPGRQHPADNCLRLAELRLCRRYRHRRVQGQPAELHPNLSRISAVP
jgi:hypothetical protein